MDNQPTPARCPGRPEQHEPHPWDTETDAWQCNGNAVPTVASLPWAADEMVARGELTADEAEGYGDIPW